MKWFIHFKWTQYISDIDRVTWDSTDFIEIIALIKGRSIKITSVFTNNSQLFLCLAKLWLRVFGSYFPFSASIVNFRRSILHVACFILIAVGNFLNRFLSPSKNSREKKKIGRKKKMGKKKKDEVKKTCLLCGRKEIERTIFQVFTLLVAMNYPLHHTFLPDGKISRDVVNGMNVERF